MVERQVGTPHPSLTPVAPGNPRSCGGCSPVPALGPQWPSQHFSHHQETSGYSLQNTLVWPENAGYLEEERAYRLQMDSGILWFAVG